MKNITVKEQIFEPKSRDYDTVYHNLFFYIDICCKVITLKYSVNTMVAYGWPLLLYF